MAAQLAALCIHALDLGFERISATSEHQQETVARALSLGGDLRSRSAQ